jgi:hypothetical protein
MDDRWAQILKDLKDLKLKDLKVQDLKLKLIMDDGQVGRWHHRLVVEGHTHTNLLDGHHRLQAKELEAEDIGKDHVSEPVSEPVSAGHLDASDDDNNIPDLVSSDSD